MRGAELSFGLGHFLLHDGEVTVGQVCDIRPGGHARLPPWLRGHPAGRGRTALPASPATASAGRTPRSRHSCSALPSAAESRSAGASRNPPRHALRIDDGGVPACGPGDSPRLTIGSAAGEALTGISVTIMYERASSAGEASAATTSGTETPRVLSRPRIPASEVRSSPGSIE
jgi:hypothetical protein